MSTPTTLKPCPCGKTPSQLFICDTNQGGKYADVLGDCCSEWKLEFRQQYTSGDAAMKLATDAWNSTPRGGYVLEGAV